MPLLSLGVCVHKSIQLNLLQIELGNKQDFLLDPQLFCYMIFATNKCPISNHIKNYQYIETREFLLAEHSLSFSFWLNHESRPESLTPRQRQTSTPRQDQNIRRNEKFSLQRVGQGSVDPRGRSRLEDQAEDKTTPSYSQGHQAGLQI